MGMAKPHTPLAAANPATRALDVWIAPLWGGTLQCPCPRPRRAVDKNGSLRDTFVQHEFNQAPMMATVTSHPTVKVVGANGQISLGKQFAGRQVLVEEREPGVWMVRTATVIPDNERWLQEPQAAADLQAALAWAAAHPASEAYSDDVLKRLADGEH